MPHLYLLWFSAKATPAALMSEVVPLSLLGVYGRLGLSNSSNNLYFLILSSECLIPISLTCTLYYFFPTVLWVYSVLFLTNWKQPPNYFSSNINLRL